jgi:hypothetical protein
VACKDRDPMPTFGRPLQDAKTVIEADLRSAATGSSAKTVIEADLRSAATGSSAKTVIESRPSVGRYGIKYKDRDRKPTFGRPLQDKIVTSAFLRFIPLG